MADRLPEAQPGARDDAPLEPVRTRLGVRRNDDLVGREDAERVLDRENRIRISEDALGVEAAAPKRRKAAAQPLDRRAPSSSDVQNASLPFSAGATTSTPALPSSSKSRTCRIPSLSSVSFATTRMRRRSPLSLPPSVNIGAPFRGSRRWLVDASSVRRRPGIRLRRLCAVA